jgi:hypothetical protein
MTICWKKALLDHKKTALEFKCDVARNSPDGAKSTDSGAFLNLTQSTSAPVMMSHTRMHLSIEELISHLESGCEKHKSVTRLVVAFGKNLTFLSPFLAFRRVIERSELANATRSFYLL